MHFPPRLQALQPNSAAPCSQPVKQANTTLNYGRFSRGKIFKLATRYVQHWGILGARAAEIACDHDFEK